MSTRSAIGIKENGTIKAIYSHSDGYPGYVGKLLQEYYCTPDQIKTLLSNGDLSILKKYIWPDPTKEHGFDYDKRQLNVCVFYCRDRGDDWCDTSMQIFGDEESFIKYYADSIYFYLFENGIWRYRTRNDKEWIRLTPTNDKKRYNTFMKEYAALCSKYKMHFEVAAIKNPQDYELEVFDDEMQRYIPEDES